MVTLILVPTVWFEWRWQATQQAANRAVQAISGRVDAAAECQRMGGNIFQVGSELGYVAWQDGDERGTGAQAFLIYDTCRDLRGWLFGDKDAPTLEEATAVHIVAHEAMHVAGFRDEAETECQAMLWDATVAEYLGATPQQATDLARTYREQIWPRLRSNYRMDCEEVEIWVPGQDPANTEAT